MPNMIKELADVILERRGKVGIVALNRPKKMNSLSDGLLDTAYAAIQELAEDNEIRAIIIKGEGRAFCAGYDLAPREVPIDTVLGWRGHAEHGSRLMFAIWNCRKPVIAQVHGHCLGGGCDIAMVCDFTIAAGGTMFGEPEVQFNSAPPFAIMPYVLGMKKTKELLLLGDSITAAEAERIGLVTRVVPQEALEQEVMNLARKLAKMPVPSMTLNKETINRTYEMAGLTNAIHYGENNFATIIMSKTPFEEKFYEIIEKEGMGAAFKWRDAYFASTDDE